MYGVNFNLEGLLEAILKGRKSGYAGSAGKVSNPQRPGFKEFAPFVLGDWEYLDSYSGHYYAPGQEIVRFKGVPVWNMAYNGGMLPEFHGDTEMTKKTFNFLKQALLNGIDERMFARGPSVFPNSDFVYLDHPVGDITQFKGNERILINDGGSNSGKKIFSQDYLGGLIIHKGHGLIQLTS